MMEEILVALGCETTVFQRLRLIGLFSVVTFGFLVIGHILYVLFQWSFLLFHTVGWVLWFGWQGWLFPRNRERYICSASATAYRKAFYRDILFGVSFGVAQMLRPVFYGLLTAPAFSRSLWQLGAALLVSSVGITLLSLGFRTIGLARAGFLAEYCDLPHPLLQNNVYTYIRHPLFLGGVITCVGVDIFFSSSSSFLSALLNIAALPAYKYIEDSRLMRVFGEKYEKYCIDVGGIVPDLKVILITIRRKHKKYSIISILNKRRLEIFERNE